MKNNLNSFNESELLNSPRNKTDIVTAIDYVRCAEDYQNKLKQIGYEVEMRIAYDAIALGFSNQDLEGVIFVRAHDCSAELMLESTEPKAYSLTSPNFITELIEELRNPFFNARINEVKQVLLQLIATLRTFQNQVRDSFDYKPLLHLCSKQEVKQIIYIFQLQLSFDMLKKLQNENLRFSSQELDSIEKELSDSL